MGPARQLGVAALAFALGGCTAINAFDDPPIVGDWKGGSQPGNEMTVELEGEGDAILLYSLSDQNGSDRFKLRWEQSDIDEYELKMRCQEGSFGCDGHDFTMKCSISGDFDELDCRTGAQLWANYPNFDWEAD